MIWGYRNSLKAWQLWNMKKPHHIKGCEINFSAEIICNKIKTPRCSLFSHLCQNLVCWVISCLTQRKCRWKLGIVERPLDILSASANCPLDTNFTFRTLRTELLSAIDTHSPLYVTQLHTVQWLLYLPSDTVTQTLHSELCVQISWAQLTQTSDTILLHSSTKKVQSLLDLPSDKNFTLYFLTTLPIVDFKFPLLQVIHMSSHW